MAQPGSGPIYNLTNINFAPFTVNSYSKVSVVEKDEASEDVKAILTEIEGAFGMVPNLFKTYSQSKNLNLRRKSVFLLLLPERRIKIQIK